MRVHNEPRFPYSEANANGIPPHFPQPPVRPWVDGPRRPALVCYCDVIPSDPILRTLATGFFLSCFQPLAAMPKPLLEHIRGTISSVQNQSERLLKYTSTDVRTFLQRGG